MNKALVDTDIIIKLGKYEGEDFLYQIFKAIPYDLLIHKYNIEEELLQPENAVRQINQLLSDGFLNVVSRCDLSSIEKSDYDSTLSILEVEFSKVRKKKKRNDEGEKRSLSYAFVKKYKMFISDDRSASVIAKRVLKYTNGNWVETMKLDEIVKFVKETKLGISRKDMKRIYINTVNPKMAKTNEDRIDLERLYKTYKNRFDSELWELDEN